MVFVNVLCVDGNYSMVNQFDHDRPCFLFVHYFCSLWPSQVVSGLFILLAQGTLQSLELPMELAQVAGTAAGLKWTWNLIKPQKHHKSPIVQRLRNQERSMS
ncbi:uncharacterized protein LOC131076585 isoform X2 [Cryptomeria japonica]|uniref:uncharacterized protein LOC131076585 isoform X2 n=1 Tax=Cryptomeria japonica TaxID=3369 RepID=UPI0027DA6DCC|nr:uncharacterized protein LOC131076585 isoform X2 [Cryptomeria japonica]